MDNDPEFLRNRASEVRRAGRRPLEDPSFVSMSGNSDISLCDGDPPSSGEASDIESLRQHGLKRQRLVNADFIAGRETSEYDAAWI